MRPSTPAEDAEELQELQQLEQPPASAWGCAFRDRRRRDFGKRCPPADQRARRPAGRNGCLGGTKHSSGGQPVVFAAAGTTLPGPHPSRTVCGVEIDLHQPVAFSGLCIGRPDF